MVVTTEEAITEEVIIMAVAVEMALFLSALVTGAVVLRVVNTTTLRRMSTACVAAPQELVPRSLLRTAAILRLWVHLPVLGWVLLAKWAMNLVLARMVLVLKLSVLELRLLNLLPIPMACHPVSRLLPASLRWAE